MSSIDLHRKPTQDEGAYRGLWGAVVLQAKADIQTEPLRSLEFEQAVAFFTGGGDWVQTRTAIADFLELHRDDLERMGRRCINERRAAEGLEPLPARPVPSPRRRASQASTHRPAQASQANERARRELYPSTGNIQTHVQRGVR